MAGSAPLLSVHLLYPVLRSQPIQPAGLPARRCLDTPGLLACFRIWTWFRLQPRPTGGWIDPSPLWSIVTAPAHWLEPLGTDAVVLAVKLVGTVLALVSVGMAKTIGRKLGGSEIAGVLSATVLALDPRLAFSALSGMETCLLLALWLGAVHNLLKNRIWLAACLASLLPTTRPESLVTLPLFVLAAFLSVHGKRIQPRQLWSLLVLPVPMLGHGACIATMQMGIGSPPRST